MSPRRALAAVLLAALAACGDSTGPSDPDDAGATWATWVLASGSALRPPAPAPTNAQATAQELATVQAAQASLNATRTDAIRRWDGPPALEWNRIAEQRLSFYWALLPDVRTATPVRAGRAMALLNIAMYDALVATWDAKYAYRRPAPADVDSRVRRLVETGRYPAFPSEHAAAAAAAAEILAYAIPDDDPASFEALAAEAGASRIDAGAAFPSDVEAGRAIGREVARRIIAIARQDGSDRVWTGSPPTGDRYWLPTPPRRAYPPLDPLAGEWRPWVLTSAAQFRPAPHPDLGSAAFTADLNELRQLAGSRTAAQADAARFWATDPPSSRWIDFMLDEIVRRDLPALRSARALTLASVAMYDAFLACWDGKFFYWLLRPITADPTITTVFATPAFPSYPSGHSTVSAAAAEVFAYLFPDRAAYYHDRAAEASNSRVWGGVHYRFDITAGETLGSRVGAAVVARARTDGADR